MKKIFFILMIISSSLYSMDDAWTRALIEREQNHEYVLRSFDNYAFQRNKMSRTDVEDIVRQLQGLRGTAGYSYLIDRGLLCLAKKSRILGNLGDELQIAKLLLAANANIKYSREVIAPYSGPLTETGVAPLGHKTKFIKESTFSLATGDLRDLFDQIEAGK
jgi:hypothetical protein